MDIAGDPAALPPVLTAVEPSFHIENPDALPGDDDGFRRLRLTTTRQDDLGEALLKALSAQPAFRLRGLNRAHSTLEDVFLAATKRSWDVVDEASSPTRPSLAKPPQA